MTNLFLARIPFAIIVLLAAAALLWVNLSRAKD
jgi:hypothetical protein